MKPLAKIMKNQSYFIFLISYMNLLYLEQPDQENCCQYLTFFRRHEINNLQI